MNRSSTSIAGLLTLIGSLVAFGCSADNGSRVSSSPSSIAVQAAGGEEGAVYHTVTQADEATTRGSTPLSGEYTKLWINGMGCPQCVTNVDLQLERRYSATDIRVDLESGMVYARFPSKRPTPDQLTSTIKDAGVTLVKVESGSASLDPAAGAH